MRRTFPKAKSQAAYSIGLLVFFGITVESQKYVGQIQGHMFTSSGHAFTCAVGISGVRAVSLSRRLLAMSSLHDTLFFRTALCEHTSNVYTSN
jgi:hypothetical protein